MSNITVSVVVPMYNVQQYAAECIESILNQTHRELEIILVNDGSTDATPEICRSYAAKDDRIIFIDKENGGPTSCRTAGLKQTRGEYVYFSDSDDVLEPQLVEKLLAACVENDAQISACGFRKFGAVEQIYKLKTKASVIEKRDFDTEIVPSSVYQRHGDETVIYPYYWNHLYKTDCLDESCFISDRECTCEDIYTNLTVLKNVERIAVVDDILYNYRISANSITVAYRENRFEKNLCFFEFVKDYLKSRNLSCEDRIYRLVYGAAYGDIDNYCKSGSYAVFRDGMKKMHAAPGIDAAVKKSLDGRISTALKITGLLYCMRVSLPLYLFRKLILKSKGIG